MALARLRIEGKSGTGSGQRIWLNDREISNVTQAVSVDLSVKDVNTATITVYVDELEIGTDAEPVLVRASGAERTSFASRFREWLRV